MENIAWQNRAGRLYIMSLYKKSSRNRKLSVSNIYNGKKNKATFFPASEDSGLVFKLKGDKIPIKLDFAENMRKAIGLRYEGTKIHLIEHFQNARQAGLGTTFHTGEATDTIEMWEVVTKIKPEKGERKSI